LAQERDEDNFRSQVEDRLDHLFEEESPETTEGHVALAEHPLKGLKAVLLSIDWEITDSTMDSLLNEIKNVEYVYSEDKIILTFLQLLGSIGKYVKANKSKAHPEATRVINSVYEALERVALTEGMSRPEKERMLLEEVGRFKKLKEQVVLRKLAKKEPAVSEVIPPPEPAPEEKRIPVTESPTPEGVQLEARREARFAELSPHEAFAYALEELKNVIQAEFRALRAEIKLWRESR
jgi:hypothetical protein